MQSIKIKDNKIYLCINDDESKVISFDPNDVGFASRYYDFLDSLRDKESEYLCEAKSIDESDCDKNEKTKQIAKLLAHMCEEVKNNLDIVFGVGTMDKIFGDTLRPDMFKDLLIGIAPYINSARDSKVEKYFDDKTNGVQGVME